MLDNPNKGASNSLQQAFRTQYKAAKRWRDTYKKQRLSRSMTLSSSGFSQSQLAELILATSPGVYSAASNTFGYIPVGPPQAQKDCATCTAFAVVAAAEAAVASGMEVNGDKVRLSEQDLYFCSSADSSTLRTCGTGWKLDKALEVLTSRQLRSRQCLPYDPSFQYDDPSQGCQGFCTDRDPLASQGQFRSVALDATWRAQEHIRIYGGVITRFDILSDFRRVFLNQANKMKVYSPQAGAALVEQHAVLLVGYDNEKEYWVVKNSWGRDWADGGFFKVRYLFLFRSFFCASLSPCQKGHWLTSSTGCVGGNVSRVSTRHISLLPWWGTNKLLE